MRPTLRQLQYLVAIADTGRFGEAAERLHVSQPSLSSQIAEMEASLGTVLLERGRHGASLTPIGTEIVQRARRILGEVEELKAAARHSEGQLHGRMRLGVLPSIGPYLLPEAAKRLHTLFPDLRLALREERTIDLDAHLSDGRLDAVISTAEDHPSCKSLPLFQEDLWICTAAEDPLGAEPAPLRLNQLKGKELLSLGYGHGLSQIVSELARKASAHVSTEFEGTSLDAIRHMAVMGAGVAVVPSLYVASEVRWDQDLVARRLAHSGARRRISLIWRATSPLASQFDRLGEVLRDVGQDILRGL